MRTRFTELVGCEFPVQLAAMGGGIGTPRLAYAVAAAGGLGMVGVSDFDRGALVEAFGTGGARGPGQQVGAGFLMPFLDRGTVAAVAPLVTVIEFFYGDPDPALVRLGHDGGALVSWQVGSAEEARAAAGAGCDFLIAQGIEAGGHLRGKTGLLMLLDAVLGAVEVPVLAAGGVATARGMAAALAAGADGVRVGTRFLLAQESSAHPRYRAAIIAAGAGDTVVTSAFRCTGLTRRTASCAPAWRRPPAAAARPPAPATPTAGRFPCSRHHRRRTRPAAPSMLCRTMPVSPSTPPPKSCQQP